MPFPLAIQKYCWHFSLPKLTAISLLLILRTFSTVHSIRCYECTSGPNDWTCGEYVGTSCGYGFFGCVKVATYDGGVDKMGNFIDDPQAVVSMIRGCNLLPLGGVDACQQQMVLGYRIITCYCYSDYCNGALEARRIAGIGRTILFAIGTIFTSFLFLRIII